MRDRASGRTTRLGDGGKGQVGVAGTFRFSVRSAKGREVEREEYRPGGRRADARRHERLPGRPVVLSGASSAPPSSSGSLRAIPRPRDSARCLEEPVRPIATGVRAPPQADRRPAAEERLLPLRRGDRATGPSARAESPRLARSAGRPRETVARAVRNRALDGLRGSTPLRRRRESGRDATARIASGRSALAIRTCAERRRAEFRLDRAGVEVSARRVFRRIWSKR